MARRKKPEDEPDDMNDQNNGNDDDTFGLPEIEYEPINRESPPAEEVNTPEPEEPQIEEPEQSEQNEAQPVTNTPMERDEARQSEYDPTYYEEEENSPWPKILGIAALLLIVGAAAWYFGWKKPQDDAAAAERARQEQQARIAADSAAQARNAEEQRMAAENQRIADSLALANATPPAGTIETLNGRTGRYYVVVASAIDGDLLMDYAKELSKKGVSTKIIAPYGNVKFHRLTVAEGDSFAAAAQIAERLKGEYTDGTWVIKY